MSAPKHNPQRHNRRSIRLKGHDYAGGGTYFVTICVHRTAGDIFAPADVKNMIADVWRGLPNSPVGAPLVGALFTNATMGTHEGCPYVVMPDHFHAMVCMQPGKTALGNIIGAFKSLVVHEYIKGVKSGNFAPFPGKIWQRNYYEMIVRTPEMAENIRQYIRMNPWRLVQHAKLDGQSYRMIGNPALLNRRKKALLCSRSCPADILAAAKRQAKSVSEETCIISGFHSPAEQAILKALLKSSAKLICCPAWGIDTMKIPPSWLPALEANRMLLMEMRNKEGNLAAAEERNRFILSCTEDRWIPHATSGGMLDRLLQEANQHKRKTGSVAL